ncbi:hypothetical protein [Micromonospora ureilytica]|uniref:PLL-like beta propeller domain-containing protein n=1 Tax=Micromonospora ureilytica TaxID=709868 RepID=A0ABS0JAQ9_9ACTN|nr:hypothetical protein [Micromonospora ureilytica]MBG6064144.1 hypothetical protein [Micromonospora ureilytica]
MSRTLRHGLAVAALTVASVVGPVLATPAAHASIVPNCTVASPTAADAAFAARVNPLLNGKLAGYLDATRAACVRVIVSVVKAENLPMRAATIAITTTIVETGIRNLDYGADDSLGLYQQRPSQGWGSSAQVMDPIYSTKKFLSAMRTKYPNNGWLTAPIGEICQRVQISAYPDRYAEQAADGATIALAAWGQDRVEDELAVGANADGRLQAFAVRGAGAVHSLWQTAPNGGFGDWVSLGGSALRHPVVDSAADGRMELFVVGGDGKLYHKWQQSPNGPFSEWVSRGGSDLSADLAVGRNADGRLQVFVVGGNGSLYSTWQTTANGAWASWVSLGGSALRHPVVDSAADGRMELFVVGGDGKLYHKWQQSPNGPFSEWVSRGGSDLSADLAVGRNADGRLQVFVVGGNGSLYSTWQTTANGAWASWVSLGGSALRHPVVDSAADGRMELFVVGGDGKLYHKWQQSPNGPFSEWVSRGGSDLSADLAVGRNADGRLQVFVVGGNGSLYSAWQTTPNGPWAAWFNLG